MRVDFKKGAITVFLNGDHLGDMVKAGVKGPLSGCVNSPPQATAWQ